MISLGLVLLLAACAVAIPESPCTITVYSPQGTPYGQRPINLKDLLNRPVNILADVRSGPNFKGGNTHKSPFGRTFQSFFLQRGLRALKDFHNFAPLYNYLINSEDLSAVAFYPGDFHNPSFFKNFASDVVFQDSFSLHNLFNALTERFPILIITPQYDFVSSEYRGLTDIGTFLLTNSSHQIERDFNQGYGPNFSQGYGPNFNQAYGQNFNQGYGQNFNQGYGPNFNQGYGPNLNQGYGPNFNKGYSPNFNRRFGPFITQEYGPFFDQEFGKESHQSFGPRPFLFPAFGQNFSPSISQGVFGDDQEVGFPSALLSNRFGSPENLPPLVTGAGVSDGNPGPYPTLIIPVKEEDVPSSSSGNVQVNPSVKLTQNSGYSSSEERRGQDQRRQREP